jgi:hypothetical protein
VLKLAVLDLGDRRFVEALDPRLRASEQDGGVGRDDELGSGLGGTPQDIEERDLASRRERRLGSSRM